jgi:Cu(I)/Ag(I) efflux system membrane fusion protein/cobalt-zinc-cadmium efflux system membrane fusion protein
MNKYVVRTSLVWLAILAAFAAIFVLNNHSRQAPVPKSDSIEPVATGPDTAPQASNEPTQMPMDVPLAEVQLSPEKMQSIGVKTGAVEYRDLTDDVRSTGTVDVNERLVAYVQIRFPGYIRQVFANATYLFVHKGDPLFTVYSPDLLQTQKEFLLAQKSQYQLRGSSVDGVKEGADSMGSAAEDRLRQWAIPEEEITRLEQTGKPTADMTINSPVTGYIVERNALPNSFADLSTRLYTIADLSHVWVNAQIYQNEIGEVHEGETAAITVDSYPGQVFHAKIESILPQVDTTTRTVKVRLDVMNADLKLKPGMFVNVDLKTNLGRKLVVPASAVFQTGLRQIAFLDRGNGNLAPQEISVGQRVGDYFVVTKGLALNDRIVTSANFLIDSESQLEANTSSAASAAPPQQTAASAPAPALHIDFATDPAPPHQGKGNKLTVKLTREDGTPFAGADVSVVFLMPAMPAMNMAAVNDQANLRESGSGVYHGVLSLPYGGGYQVTVRVNQNGQQIATRKLNVVAEGGM